MQRSDKMPVDTNDVTSTKLIYDYHDGATTRRRELDMSGCDLFKNL